ncbi:YuzB family protein [Listeria seeligeri]|uniref:YuzB family protein n=1 Tax=Listeria TaxID=1637 RepID=UPI001624E716|nr:MULTISPECIES: YuzB family protein [Listeria]MBC1578325.1 YuzB family protein [Listeria seeligeri]MBC1757672.1 YuzB family protein [Listeria seeligeri]MBC1816198.1 YuzB family protein [Listeria seeligeri]MBC1990531.1 YuzB family protein [Listeria seeligeri]MBC2030541.1 YuzB family protein [Listeria seeligeri]
MNPIVEFCVNNLASGADVAFAKLDADDSLDVIEYDCLTYCDLCATSLFALVDGEVVRGETPDELVANIYTFLEENPF